MTPPSDSSCRFVAGITVGNAVTFADNLARRGITRVRKGKGVRGFKGVQINQNQTANGPFG
jgi:hypothetical protein